MTGPGMVIARHGPVARSLTLPGMLWRSRKRLGRSGLRPGESPVAARVPWRVRLCCRIGWSRRVCSRRSARSMFLALTSHPGDPTSSVRKLSCSSTTPERPGKSIEKMPLDSYPSCQIRVPGWPGGEIVQAPTPHTVKRLQSTSLLWSERPHDKVMKDGGKTGFRISAHGALTSTRSDVPYSSGTETKTLPCQSPTAIGSQTSYRMLRAISSLWRTTRQSRSTTMPKPSTGFANKTRTLAAVRDLMRWYSRVPVRLDG
jgi:hypothetical protein